MSGGRLNYLYCTIANELGIPSGSYGIGEGKYGSYKEEVRASRRNNPMHDTDLSELMYDVSCLLHSLEWYESGDTGEDDYIEDVKKFKEKWFARNSKQSIQEYKADVLDYLKTLCANIEASA